MTISAGRSHDIALRTVAITLHVEWGSPSVPRGSLSIAGGFERVADVGSRWHFHVCGQVPRSDSCNRARFLIRSLGRCCSTPNLRSRAPHRGGSDRGDGRLRCRSAGAGVQPQVTRAYEYRKQCPPAVHINMLPGLVAQHKGRARAPTEVGVNYAAAMAQLTSGR